MAKWHVQESPAGLADRLSQMAPRGAPEPTQARKVRRVASAPRTGRVESLELPALDLQAIAQKEGQAVAVYGTFRAPVDLKSEQWESCRNRAVTTFVTQQLAQGMSCVLPKGIQVNPGCYPARDLMSGEDLWDQREYVIGAWFYQTVPRMIRVPIDPDWVKPVRLG